MRGRHNFHVSAWCRCGTTEAGLSIIPQAPDFLPWLAGDCRLESGSLPSCKWLAQTKRRVCIDSSEGKGNAGPQIRYLPDSSRVHSAFPSLSGGFSFLPCLQNPVSVVGFILWQGSPCGYSEAPCLHVWLGMRYVGYLLLSSAPVGVSASIVLMLSW